MPAIGVTDDVYDRISLLAQAWEVPQGQVISRLLEEFRRKGQPREPESTGEGVVPVHVVYAGVRTGATFDPVTEGVTITSGPLAGQSFRTPSGAAIALVAALRPTVNPTRNGWSFWVVSATGEYLRSVRRS